MKIYIYDSNVQIMVISYTVEMAREKISEFLEPGSFNNKKLRIYPMSYVFTSAEGIVVWDNYNRTQECIMK